MPSRVRLSRTRLVQFVQSARRFRREPVAQVANLRYDLPRGASCQLALQAIQCRRAFVYLALDLFNLFGQRGGFVANL